MGTVGNATPDELAAALKNVGIATPDQLAAAGRNQPGIVSQGLDAIQRAGTAAEGAYEKYQPAAQTLAGTLADFDPRRLLHPGKALMNPLPSFPMAVGNALAPNTIAGLGRDVMTLYNPETWYQRVLGTTGVSAALGAATGKDPATEGFYGLLQSGPPEILSGLSKWGLAKLGNRAAPELALDTMGKFGDKLIEKFPFLKRFNLQKGSDFVKAFQDKEAVQAAKDEMAGVNANLAKKTMRVPDTIDKTVSVPDPANPGQMIQKTVKVPNPANPGGMVDKPITYNVKVPDPVRRGMSKDAVMTYDQANNLLDELHTQGFSSLHGEPPGGVKPAFARKLADANKDAMVAKLNRLHPGSGDEFAVGRKGVGAMHTLGEVFDKKGLFDKGVLRQEPMVDQLTEHSSALQHSGGMTADEVSGLRTTLTHGETEPGKFDIPQKKGKWHWSWHPHLLNPLAVRISHEAGHAFEPVGKDLPYIYRAGEKLIPNLRQLGSIATGHYFGNQDVNDSTGGASNPPAATPPGATPPGPGASAGGSFSFPSFEGTAYGAEFPPGMDPSTGKPKTPAMDHIEALQNREVAPTPGGASRAGEIRQSLGPGRKPTDITQDLNRGRLSSDEVKKLLQHSSSKNPGRLVSGIPLTDLMSAAETGTPQEKQMLVPLIQARLQQELPQLANKTMQANLARRFQLLRGSVQPSGPSVPPGAPAMPPAPSFGPPSALSGTGPS